MTAVGQRRSLFFYRGGTKARRFAKEFRLQIDAVWQAGNNEHPMIVEIKLSAVCCQLNAKWWTSYLQSTNFEGSTPKLSTLSFLLSASLKLCQNKAVSVRRKLNASWGQVIFSDHI